LPKKKLASFATRQRSASIKAKTCGVLPSAEPLTLDLHGRFAAARRTAHNQHAVLASLTSAIIYLPTYSFE
jgi:hypothetical protein